jgi:hypothetical protein
MNSALLKDPARSRHAIVLALTALLAGCAGIDLGEVASGLGIRRAEPGTPSGFSFTPDNKAQASMSIKPLIGSELDGLLKKHPITNGQRPETWPRVAITIASAAPSLFKNTSVSGSASVGAMDCATYNIKVWTSATESKAYDGLRLCYGELYQRLQRVPLYQVPTWGRRSFWRDEKTSGSVRGDGPLPPTDHFPNDPALQDLWLDTFKNTLAFVAGPLHVLGYNGNDTNDKRIWFVAVPSAR